MSKGNRLKYFTCIGLPFFFQVTFTYIVSANAGGGSFVGLGALLLALGGIPLTLIANIILVRARPGLAEHRHFIRSFLIALVLPLVQLGLLVAVSVFRL